MMNDTPSIYNVSAPHSSPEPSDEGSPRSPYHPLQNSRHSSPSPTFLHSPASPAQKAESFDSPRVSSFERYPHSSATPPAFRRSLTPTPQGSPHSHGLSPRESVAVLWSCMCRIYVAMGDGLHWLEYCKKVTFV